VRDSVLAHGAISRGATVLDVGAGDGLIAFGALEHVGDEGCVIFSDVSADLLEYCSALAQELGVASRCQFVRASADDRSSIPDGSVDVVTTRSVLIYVKDKASALCEFHRVLRPGGRVSIYEPINRRMCDPGRLWGYDVSPVAHLYDKLQVLHSSLQDCETDPMLDFDEQDLLSLAEWAGFETVHLELRVDIEPETDAVPWETFANSSGNPLVPTLREAIDDVLTEREAAEFEAHLRPLVEQGHGRRHVAAAFLWATKAS